MRRFIVPLALTCGLGLALGALPEPLEAQEPLEVGARAPDFTLPGAVRHGVLAEPVTLSDYEGQTVVLSFFFRARTKG
jgi:hypothetical protein